MRVVGPDLGAGTARGTAQLLADIVEADDAGTAQHSRHVVELSLATARRLGLGADARRRVELGALLHDVGKLAIPAAIRQNPGRLTVVEWSIMRQHTDVGGRMLAAAGDELAEIAPIVRASHERWDGRGYPDGLAGEAIPLEARIVAVCDAYSAMTSDRPYRQALRSPRPSPSCAAGRARSSTRALSGRSSPRSAPSATSRSSSRRRRGAARRAARPRRG